MNARLPIFEIEREILAGINEAGRVIISAPTGSGKSTQVPQLLVAQLKLDGQIVVLQPRRLAARLLAKRVANERQARLGAEVGYQIRFENVTSPETRIRFVTEGVLLRQMLRDPGLRGVAALIFDEFHERHLEGDITLARAVELQHAARPDLKLVVMSATLEQASLEQYLAPCRTIEARGRGFPIEIDYAPQPSYLDNRPIWEQAASAFANAQSLTTGDVLIFMPGAFEISQTIGALRRLREAEEFVLLPLHGELSAREQDAAVASYGRRKVVVTTNVAETSITIEGITCVIDSGLARIPRYDPYRGINTLAVEKISRAACDQRAGRAGRTGPGRCIRLWSQAEHGHRPEHELPEVKRLDLAEVVLTLKASGIDDLNRFRWLEPPPAAALARAEELLTDLGALAAPANAPADGIAHAVLTPLGRRMLAFPLHPRYARLLLAANDFGCVREACLVAALTQGRDLLVRNADEQVLRRREGLLPPNAASDFTLLMRAWEYVNERKFDPEICRQLGIQAAAARQVTPLFEQFLEIACREELDTAARAPSESALRKATLAAFSDRVARRLEAGGARCELVHGRRGTLVRESIVQQSRLLAAAEVREVQDKGASTWLSLVTAIEEEWLRELFPDDMKRELRVDYDPAAKRVFAVEESRFRGLAISSRRVEPPPAEPAARLLADEVVAGRLVLNQWDESVEQWIARLNQLREWCPELELPALSSEDRRVLIEQICDGAVGYKEIKDRPVLGIVKAWLSGPQQQLVEEHAPERLRLANGRLQKIIYQAGSAPRMEVRIQQLYGVEATPRIAMRRVPVVVHILAPNMRPVQITQDLAGFWREHYPKVKQELQRKYPKHEWR